MRMKQFLAGVLAFATALGIIASPTVYDLPQLLASAENAEVTGVSVGIGDCDIYIDGPCFYTGSKICPKVTVRDGENDKTLTEGTDYTLEYKDNSEVGTAAVTVKGKGVYTGEKTEEFDIIEKSLENCLVVCYPTETYTGNAIIPYMRVLYCQTYFDEDSKSAETRYVELTKDIDYIAEYENNVELGTATVKVKGVGEFSGMASTTFEIVNMAIEDCCEIWIYGEPFFYTGDEVKPGVYVVDDENGRELVEGVDYTVEYKDNTEIGTGTVTVAGIGGYGGSYSREFKIVEKSVSSLTVFLRGSTFYNGGEEIRPEVFVFYYESYLDKNDQCADGRPVYLTEGKDYTLAFENNREIGTATVTITGGDDFPGTVTKEFEISKKDLERDCYTGIYPTVFRYTGEEIKPNIHSNDYRIEKVLVEGVDYIAEYKDNVELGTGTVTITGIGDYIGSYEYPFRIIDDSIENFDVAVFAPNYYTGKPIEPEVKVYYEDVLFNETFRIFDQKYIYLEKDKDYTLSYENNTEVGTATVTIKGIGDYTGEVVKEFEIKKFDIASDASASIYGGPFFYTGKEIKPGILVCKNSDYKALVEGVDYTLSYSDNTEIGKGTVTVTGIGGCEGTKTVSFDIVEKTIDICRISIDTVFYTGEALEPDMEVYYRTTERRGNNIADNVVVLARDVDYTLTFKNNVEVGNASVTVTGIGEFSGEVTKYFNIGLPDISNDCIYNIHGKTCVVTGSEIRPGVEFFNYHTGEKLIEGVDFTLTYENNVEVGNARIIVTGIGRYTGKHTLNFKIIEKNIENLNPYYAEAAIYTGQPVKPYVSMYYEYFVYDEYEDCWLDKDYDLIEGKDYTLACTNNTDIGTGTATITCIGEFSGTITFDFEIRKPNIDDDCRITVYSRPFFYTGSEIIPAIGVSNIETGKVLTEGVDYTVEISDNIEIGEATVKVTGMGDYEGVGYATFDIIEKSIENCDVHLKDNALYTGGPVKPIIEVFYRKYKDIDDENADGWTYKYTYLTEGVDYTATYKNNIEIGTATVTITGIGEFTGAYSEDFTIRETTVSRDFRVNIYEEPIFFTGSPVTPAVRVRDMWTGEVLTEGVDYTLKYSNNIKPGTASVIVTGMNKYKGSSEYKFTIDEKSIEICDVRFDEFVKYTGSEVIPEVTVGFVQCDYDAKTDAKTTTYTVLKEGVDYKVTCSDNVEKGRAKLTVTGIGDYKGTVSKTFYICESIECETVEQLQSSHPYNNNVTAIYTYKVPGAQSLAVTFSDDTYFEYRYDYLRIYTDKENCEDYEWNSLAGQTVLVMGDTLKMAFFTDMEGTYYGFRVTSVLPEFAHVHSFGEWKTVKEATCVADGSRERTCECGETETDTIKSEGHKYTEKVVVPTASAQGYTLHTCSVCGDSYKDNYTVKVSAVTGLNLKGRTADALRIAWDKNTSADGYIVEMYKNGSWVRAAKITANSTTEFKKSGLSAGTAYKFRVKAYKMSGKTAFYSSYVNISARTNPSKVAGLKLAGRANNALRISWTKNTSADGYIVEMYKNGQWVRAAKITANSTTEFKKSGLAAGTAYKFRVKAYKMSGKTALYSGYTEISARTNPSNVTGLKTLGRAKSAVRFGWTKNTSADGYIVEMYKDGKWVRAAKITSNSTVQFKKTGLKAGTTYKFRVKAYKMSGKTALYSGYTNYNIATTK